MRGETFGLCWVKRGGPEMTSPPDTSFGLTMIERSMAADFYGNVSMDFGGRGLTIRLRGRFGDAGGDGG